MFFNRNTKEFLKENLDQEEMGRVRDAVLRILSESKLDVNSGCNALLAVIDIGMQNSGIESIKTNLYFSSKDGEEQAFRSVLTLKRKTQRL